MSEYFITIVIAFSIFMLIDILWLGLIANNLYQRELKTLLKKKVNWISAILFYIIFIVLLSIFVIVPNLDGNSIGKVVLFGALFGLATYSTYDLTNYATIGGFPLKIVIIDLTWGVFIGSITSLLTYLIYNGVIK